MLFVVAVCYDGASARNIALISLPPIVRPPPQFDTYFIVPAFDPQPTYHDRWFVAGGAFIGLNCGPIGH